MAKFIITSGSHFRPFTYDELVKPLQQMTDAQNATQDAYDQLSAETAALRHYISNDEEKDVRARRLYDDYVGKLNELQENLWNNGYSASARRDLSVAREGYFGDITRLSKAVQTRLERSKEYWDTKHNHPDRIMGIDPGTADLDKYLDDVNYGQNYFTYSGESFMSEVAADAKARADELLKDATKSIDVERNPELVGYLLTIKRNGFTSKEVQDASELARAALATGNRSAITDATPEGILANVLLSHLDSTGAQSGVNVSPEEFNRLFEYGRAGLSQAIGKTDINTLTDKQWDYQKQLSLAYAKSAGTTTKKDKTDKTGKGVTMNTLIERMESPGYGEFAGRSGRQYRQYESGPKQITFADGSIHDSYSPWETAEYVYNPEIRKRMRAYFGGLDVALDPSNWLGSNSDKHRQHGTVRYQDGSAVKVYANKMTDEQAKQLGIDIKDGVVLTYMGNDGKVHVEENATRDYNKGLQQYRDHVAAMKQLNPDIDKITITPKQEKKYREEYNIGTDIDSSDVYNIVSTKENIGTYTSATIANPGRLKDLKSELRETLIASNKHARTNAGGSLTKTSRFSFYKVGKNGTLSSTGEEDYSKLFMNGKTDAQIQDISIRPSDVAAGAGRGRPVIRFTTEASPDVWAADAEMFGSLLYNTLKAPRRAYPAGIFGAGRGTNEGNSMCDAVDFMLMPLLNPESVLRMSDAESKRWSNIMYKVLNDADKEIYSRSDINGPVIETEDDFLLPDAKQIVYTRSLQNQLYDAVRAYIDNEIDKVRGRMIGEHLKEASNGSDKGPYYLNPENNATE